MLMCESYWLVDITLCPDWALALLEGLQTLGKNKTTKHNKREEDNMEGIKLRCLILGGRMSKSRGKC